jgi:DNA polymerase-3 subunit delta
MDFVADKLIRQARGFTMERLLGLYLDAVKADSDVKHGLIDERTSLEMLIVKASAKA